MELNDIIKTNGDRLFVLDNECFIIFTGDDLTDEKPFIRIGNWLDLPPECIPLIENIVVTDFLIGNPAYEQFNIDAKYLSTNRFIGSEEVVKKYLDFQTHFGLDLNNVEIVDVEKDLPFLSKEKNISRKDAFLGIFYFNGNFKVIYNDENLFNLEEYEQKWLTNIKKLDRISEEFRESTRYSGSGLILFESSLLFYKNRYFTSYEFPLNFFEGFSLLNIDPAKLKEIILPSSNLTNITGFIKWKNAKSSLIKIFSRSGEGFDSLQRLYPDVMLKRKKFNNFSLDTGEGLSIQNYPSTLNTKLTFRNVMPSYSNLNLIYLKEYSGIENILNEDADGIIMPYSIYEQALLFLKSTDTPFILLDDGNKNMLKLKGRDILIARPKLQYEFKKFNSHDELLKASINTVINPEVKDSLAELDVDKINHLLFNSIEKIEHPDFDAIKDFLNIKGLLKIYLNYSTDRKFTSEIRKTLQRANTLIDTETIISNNPANLKIFIFFYNNFIYEFFESIEIKKKIYSKSLENTAKTTGAKPEKTDSPEPADTVNFLNNVKEFSDRIKNDRKRFLDLLELYKKSLTKKKKEISLIDKDIADRKKHFNSDKLQIDNTEIKKNILRIRIKNFSRVFFFIILILLLSFVSYIGYDYYTEYRNRIRIEEESLKSLQAERDRIKKQKNEKKELIEKYNIHVSDRDIYIYANNVAKKNGYREITFKSLKKKNPNWIFPGNIFFLIDGDRIVVKRGDTLWDISHKKLMILNIEFYKIIDMIEKSDLNKGKELKKLIKKAESFAFSKKHIKKLKSIKQ